MSTALDWLGEFLNFTPDVMLPFTPRLLLVILPNLAHHVPMILQAAQRTNQLLHKLVQSIPSPNPMSQPGSADKASIASGKTSVVTSPGPAQTFAMQSVSPPSTGGSTSPVPPRQSTLTSSVTDGQPDVTASPASDRTVQVSARQRSITTSSPAPDAAHADVESSSSNQQSRSQSPTPTAASTNAATTIQVPQSGTDQEKQAAILTQSPVQTEADPFGYHETVENLTLQFMSEHEETRVAALNWLIMLHQKVPKKVRKQTIDWYGLLKNGSCSDPSYGRRYLPCPPEDFIGHFRRGNKALSYTSCVLTCVMQSGHQT